ncbi:MAG: IS110 family transposase [Blastocatellia bacterium]
MVSFAAFIGIDWSDSKHVCCIVDASSGCKEFFLLKHSPEAIDRWATSLNSRFSGQKIALCLEQSRGPLIFALLKYDSFALYPINPSTLANYREAFCPGRAKDDPSDAQSLAELLIHHRDGLRAWLPDDAKTRTPQYLVGRRRRLVADRTRISNRLTALLKGYFPQVLGWFPDPRTLLVCDSLTRWPALQVVKKAKRPASEKFFRGHNSSRKEVISSRIDSIKGGMALTTDRAVIDSSRLMAQALAAQMKATLEAIKGFDQQIGTLCQAHQDYEILVSLPGAGPVYAPRLLAALGSNRERFTSGEGLARLSGIAAVIERSGKKVWVRWRYFCPKFIRQSFHEYAGESIRHPFRAKAYYDSRRAKWNSHAAAVRALAYKWIRIIRGCWKEKVVYNEATCLESLRKRNSPLLKCAATNP